MDILKVLCIYKAEGTPVYRGHPVFRAPLRRWQDSKMIEVTRLGDIERAFEEAMQREAETWRPSRVAPTKPERWELLSYLPEGKASQARLTGWE